MKKYIVTGANGLVGSALKKELGKNHIYHTRKDADLLNFEQTQQYIEHHIKHSGVNGIIHCAARVGGVQANINNNKLFFYENFIMSNNLTTICFQNNLPNFVNLLSTCVFPDKEVTYPLDPSQINNGAPHNSNHGYSYAKRLSGMQTDYMGKVLGHNWISIIPTNVYGEHDNFHLINGHMLPAMVHRAYLSSQTSNPMVVWGDGSPLRQLIYSRDLAKLILWAIDNWKEDSPFMAVNPKEYSILEVAQEICKNYNINPNKIILDSTKPLGQHKKPAITHAPKDFNFTSLEEGVELTVKWFKGSYKNARK